MIVVSGPFPPPVHGMAAVNVQMTVLLRRRTGVITINTAAAQRVPGFRYALARFGRLLQGVLRLIGARFEGARVFYSSVDDGIGMIVTTLMCLIARTLRMRVFLHHHSFRYISFYSEGMAHLVRIAGADATHIHLCKCMGREFQRRYPSARQITVVSNVIDNVGTFVYAPIDQKRFRLGMLSNLMFEKGLAEAVECCKVSVARGLDVELLLAGPAWNEIAEAHIRSAKLELGDRLIWLGPVHGERKERFFSNIDMLLFPTRYPSEAYPLVLLEAATRGIPSISNARGCIEDMAADLEVTLVQPGENYVEKATFEIEKQIRRNVQDRATQRNAIFSAAKLVNDRNIVDQKALVESIISASEGGR